MQVKCWVVCKNGQPVTWPDELGKIAAFDNRPNAEGFVYHFVPRDDKESHEVRPATLIVEGVGKNVSQPKQGE